MQLSASQFIQQLRVVAGVKMPQMTHRFRMHGSRTRQHQDLFPQWVFSELLSMIDVPSQGLREGASFFCQPSITLTL